MKSLFELYKPRAKKEKEWWDANKVTKYPLSKGEKTDFEGQPVKTYDRKDMGAKAGKDTAGEVCEGKKVNNQYPHTIDDEEDEEDVRPFRLSKKGQKRPKRKWPKINSGYEGSDEITEPSDVRS